MSWIRNPVTGGCGVVLPPLFCGLPGLGPWKSGALSLVSVVPPTRSKELSVLVVGRDEPVPSRHGLLGEPTPSRTVSVVSTSECPQELPVQEVGEAGAVGLSGATVPE